MTLVVLGIDALDPVVLSSGAYSNLELADYKSIETIESHTGDPSTHELWPSIITGLPPEKHGITLHDGGVAWEASYLNYLSEVASYILPENLRSRIGAWLLTKTEQDAFRIPADYYPNHGISTVFDDREAIAIGIPNYVVESDFADRETQLRRRMGDLFKRVDEAKGGHESADPDKFYELCMEMAMVRIARARRALRGGQYELVFGYTSALDLIGHVSYDRNQLQTFAYQEFDDFVGELRSDLQADDELILVSDHGLQDGTHTSEAHISSTDSGIISRVDSVLDVRSAIENELDGGEHSTSEHERTPGKSSNIDSTVDSEDVKDHLEDLGYL